METYTLVKRAFRSWGCDLAISPICLAAENLVALVEPAVHLLKRNRPFNTDPTLDFFSLFAKCLFIIHLNSYLVAKIQIYNSTRKKNLSLCFSNWKHWKSSSDKRIGKWFQSTIHLGNCKRKSRGAMHVRTCIFDA